MTLTISDTGIGISEEELPNLFTRFYQTDARHARNHGGTGLGLAISEAMVKGMKGRISVRSKVGKGTTFTVVLPATVIEQFPVSKAAITPSVDNGRRLKVLLAEDNKTNAKVAVAMLAALGHSADVVENGQELLESDWKSYDAILMDVQMPIMDGLEATRRIRAIEMEERLQQIPIYAVTASVMSEDKDECLAAGMNQVLPKPITRARLQQCLTIDDNQKKTLVGEDVLMRVRKSYGRVVAKAGFLDSFYDLFIRSSPKIEVMFLKTDFAKQKELLRDGLALIFMFARDQESALVKDKLTHIGMIHSRNRVNVHPELYELWIASLMGALAMYDVQFNSKLEAEWRQVLRPTLDYLISLY